MSSRRVLPLVLAVAGLLAIAAVAAHGGPIGHSRSTGPTSGFFDYVFTSVALIAVAIALVFLWSLLGAKWSRPAPQRTRLHLVQLLAMLVVSLLLGLALARAHFHRPPATHRKSTKQTGTNPGAATNARPNPKTIRNARLRWDEIAIVAALLAALGVAIFASRRSSPLKEWTLRPHEEVALALDESLDDLRSEPDVRRAIIAAYARMERALAAAGLPRRPSEAPFEYLSRALQSLHASAGAVARLTDLFERAKFSHHEPDESMRDEAIDALVAIRDELRSPAEAAA